MAIIENFHLSQTLNVAVSLFVAFVLASIIGAERQWRQRSAGLRTNVLVAIGAAAFVSLGLRLNGAPGGAQVTAYVVSGIGFLGAGAIMKDGLHIQGLNTAATLWCAGAIGALSGAGLAAEAVLLTIAVLAGNTLLRPLVNAINRSPIDERVQEQIYRLHVEVDPENIGEVRDLVIETLENAHYPVHHIEETERSDEAIELIATLIPTAVEPEELDAVAGALEKSSLVQFASWSAASEN